MGDTKVPIWKQQSTVPPLTHEQKERAHVVCDMAKKFVRDNGGIVDDDDNADVGVSECLHFNETSSWLSVDIVVVNEDDVQRWRDLFARDFHQGAPEIAIDINAPKVHNTGFIPWRRRSFIERILSCNWSSHEQVDNLYY